MASKTTPIELKAGAFGRPFKTQWENSDWLRVNSGKPEAGGVDRNAERFKN